MHISKVPHRFGWWVLLVLLLVLAACATPSQTTTSNPPPAVSDTLPLSNAFVTTVDTGGVNQLDSNAGGQQSDLTSLAIDESHMVSEGSLWLKWSWDATDMWTGNGQTGDACAIFDSDGDGNANYSICVRIQNNGPTQVITTTADPFFFECADTRPDRCANPDPKPLTNTDLLTNALNTNTQTNNLITPTDPFGSPGSNAPDDSTIVLKIGVSDLPAGAQLLNVCSYPSAGNGGNNAPGDCVLFPGAGFLTIVKASPDDASTTNFNFTLDPASSNGSTSFSRTGTGTVVDRISLSPGSNYSITEAALPAGWELTSVACTKPDASGAAVATGTAELTNQKIGAVEIGIGQETVCTFSNRLKRATLIVQKISLGGSGAFEFSSTNLGTSPFTLTTTAEGEPGKASKTFTDLAPGNSYALAETVPAGWDLVTATCSDGSPINAIDLAAGEAVLCTFINIKRASLTISKDADPDHTQDFQFSSSGTTDTPIGSFALDDDNDPTLPKSQTFSLKPGSYTVSEAATAGWELNGLSCTASAGSSGAQDATDPSKANLVLAPGGTVACTFVNKIKKGKITVAKKTDPANSQSFEFDPSWGDNFSLSDGQTQTFELDGGTYSVAEVNIPAGWKLESAQCSDGTTTSNPDSIVLNGQHITCTFVNDPLPDISVVKSANPTSVPETGGVVSFSFTVTNNSPLEALTLTVLSDPFFGGGLAGQGDCALPQTLAPSGSYTCTISKTVSGDFGNDHKNTVTATASDAEGNQDSASESETVTFSDVKPTVDLIKSVDPGSLPEPGGSFNYTLEVKNTSGEPVTITALSDSNAAASANCNALIGQTLAVGESKTCSYTVSHTNAGSYPNTASVTVQDDEGNSASDSDQKTVTVSDVKPSVLLEKSANPGSIPEPGGVFTFTLKITNTSVEPVTIEALSDTYTLSPACTALIGTTLAAGASVSCSYTVSQTQVGSYANTAAVTVKDDEGNTAGGEGKASVQVTDVLPTLSVSKVGNPTSVQEPGGNVNFTFRVSNTSIEPVTISELSDSVFGALLGDDDCKVGTVLAIGASCEFTVGKFVSGDGNQTHTNTFTAKATDNEGNTASASASANILIRDVLPKISVNKSVSPTSLIYTGGTVVYTIKVTNESVEAVTLTQLVDNKFGDLNGLGTCSVPQTLPVGGTYTCTFSKTLVGTPKSSGLGFISHTNEATGIAKDNENNLTTDADTATVSFFWRGRTPGYWKNHPADWPAPYAPSQTVNTAFTGPWCSTISNSVQTATLSSALGFSGGSGLDGGARNLLRAAVSALLNEQYFGSAYPAASSTADLIAKVNAALGSCDRSTMISLASTLDFWNNGVH